LFFSILVRWKINTAADDSVIRQMHDVISVITGGGDSVCANFQGCMTYETRDVSMRSHPASIRSPCIQLDGTEISLDYCCEKTNFAGTEPEGRAVFYSD
jgi:hypothetical protein